MLPTGFFFPGKPVVKTLHHTTETTGKGPFAFCSVAMVVKYNSKVAEGPFWSYGESLPTKRAA